MSSELHYDAVVIGAGTAGLTAATRLAQSGASVCLIARGHGSTHLAAGTIDVAGYVPAGGASGQADAPGPRPPAPACASATAGIAALTAAHPAHPYAKLTPDTVAASLAAFQQDVAAHSPGAYHYGGSIDRNLMLPTAAGALRPSALAPSTMLAGDRPALTKVAIVGAPQLRDFHANLCAANLQRAGIDARALSVPLLLQEADNRADLSAPQLARAADDPAWRTRFARQLNALLKDAEQVGLPAVIGIRDPAGAHADLQQLLGRPVFEIPTLPPSVPGMRMYRALASALTAAGGRIVLGPQVIGAGRCADGRVSAVTTHSAGHNTTYAADHFVLATGGLSSGGIEFDSRWQAREPIFGLTLSGLPQPGSPRFQQAYFAEHPVARIGIATGPDLRAVGAENVLVAGAALAGAAPWQEGCGEGIAIASGHRAAQVIAAELGARTVASA